MEFTVKNDFPHRATRFTEQKRFNFSLCKCKRLHLDDAGPHKSGGGECGIYFSSLEQIWPRRTSTSRSLLSPRLVSIPLLDDALFTRPFVAGNGRENARGEEDGGSEGVACSFAFRMCLYPIDSCPAVNHRHFI